MPPHSKTVRGTLDNPKTQSAIQNDERPGQHDDPISLRPDKDDSNSTDTPGGFGKPADTYGLKEKDSAPSAPSSFHQEQPTTTGDTQVNTPGSEEEKSGFGQPADTYGLGNSSSNSSSGSSSSSSSSSKNLPHSKTVRGTLANSSGSRVNRTQLGDPVSLKSETSDTDLGRDVERGAGSTDNDRTNGGKSKL